VSTSSPVTSNQAFLTVDGVDCGFVGCQYSGTGTVIEVQLGLSLNKIVYDWVSKAWAGTQGPKSGELAPYGTEKKISFENAILTDTRFTSFDSRTKAEASITLELQAQSLTSNLKSPVDDPHVPVGQKQHAWLSANFQLQIDGVDCARVFEVGAFGIATPQPSTPPPRLPILELRFPLISLASWKKWQTAAQRGQPAKNGAIRFLAPDLHTELAHVALADVKLVRLLEPVEKLPASRLGPVVASITSAEMQFERLLAA
jgi:hypothetical protein